VGIVGAVVDFGTFNLLIGLFGMVAVIASVVSFMAAVINNFLFNRYWTYPDSRSKPPIRQMIQFTIISFIGLAIRTPLFAFLEVRLRYLFESLSIPSITFIGAEFLGHNLALAIAVVVVMFWNFFVNRYWTYSDVE
jgi:putative flippase GtrA